MIRLENITKRYNSIVLDNINITLEEGIIYLLKGISGSGKTTLFNILAGLDSDYEGKYLWNDKDVNTMSTKEQIETVNQISYVFQKSYLFKDLTILENLLFIKDDLKAIKRYAEQFQVSYLLFKKPEQISGGEKQRIALIRALLLDSKIILLDEPTSSLDSKNSEIFVKFLSKISKEGKIILIATHKNIYDFLADYIIFIDYGKISIQKKKTLESVKTNNQKAYFLNSKTVEKTWRRDINFALKRKKKRVVLGLFTTILFFLLICGISLFINFKREYVKWQSSTYPVQVININTNKKDEYKDLIEKEYENYKIESDNFTGYILPDEEDSILKNSNILEYGRYPKEKNEIIVNEEFINVNYPNMDYNDALGMKITIEDNQFLITGIIHKGEYEGYLIYQNNPYYKEIDNLLKDYVTPAVFIPYEKMQEIGTKALEIETMCVIDLDTAISLYVNKEARGFHEFDYTLPWRVFIHDSMSSLDYYLLYIAIILVFATIFIFIFVVNKITLELSYRKREFGYLQLFRVKKKRILNIYLIDYLLEIFISLIVAVILYNIGCLILLLSCNLNFFMPIYIWIIIILAISVYFYYLVKTPLNKYLKKDILNLICN